MVVLPEQTSDLHSAICLFVSCCKRDIVYSDIAIAHCQFLLVLKTALNVILRYLFLSFSVPRSTVFIERVHTGRAH